MREFIQRQREAQEYTNEKLSAMGNRSAAGKLGALTCVSVDTLRYYEREGLITPARKNGSGYRVYGDDAVQRLRFIKQTQQCGFTLAEVREFLLLRGRANACCHDVRQRAIEKKLQLEHKIKTLRAMSTALDRLIADCIDEHGALDTCPILAALETGPINLGDA